MTALKRAKAWKKLALDTRKVCGDVMGLLGECAGTLEVIGDEQAKSLAERCSNFIEGVNVPVPGYIMRELRWAESGQGLAAMDRAHELMSVPGRLLPSLLQKYVAYKVSMSGICQEVCLTAFAHYAQCVEGLPCDDPQYQPSDEDRQWFKENATWASN